MNEPETEHLWTRVVTESALPELVLCSMLRILQGIFQRSPAVAYHRPVAVSGLFVVKEPETQPQKGEAHEALTQMHSHCERQFGSCKPQTLQTERRQSEPTASGAVVRAILLFIASHGVSIINAMTAWAVLPEKLNLFCLTPTSE